MAKNDDEIFFDDKDALFFKEDGEPRMSDTSAKWKVMIVDDEPEVHSITKMVLGDLVYDHKSLELINAYSGEEAKRLIGEIPDVAVILLDVVMEEEDAGLKVIKYIREELKNKSVRIILRTGQPGQAPEEKVIVEYDISDYKEKMELTARKLFTSIITAIRTYADIISLDEAYKKIQKSRDRAVRWNKVLEETVSRRTASIRILLNNAGQGFLYFGENLTVGEEYSSECTKIFGCDIKDRKYTELVFAENLSERHLLENILRNIFKEKDPVRQESYLSLISDEVMIWGKHIYIGYKVISGTSGKNSRLVMAVLTDVTEKRRLENKFKKENNTLKMIVNAVKYYNEMIECINDYKDFCKTQARDIIDSHKPIKDIVAELFMRVHTFKGSFNQWHMDVTVERLHDFETKISRLKHEMTGVNRDTLKNLFEDAHMQDWPEEDMHLLRDNLGDEFFNRDNQVVVDKARLAELEKEIDAIVPAAEWAILSEKLNSLRYRPFKELLRFYPDCVQQLAEKMEKRINPFKIRGGDFLCDNDRYRDFAKSLIHIFRNSIDHGIEFPEERPVKNKEECGNIRCAVKLLKGKIYIVIKDDGSGIDITRVREQAVRETLIGAEQAMELPDSEALNLLFVPGFSLKEHATAVSGRGMGLAAVKEELEKIGGRVKIKFRLGRGTAFYFILPYRRM